MKKSSRFSPEVCARAVRMVFEHHADAAELGSSQGDRGSTAVSAKVRVPSSRGASRRAFSAQAEFDRRLKT